MASKELRLVAERFRSQYCLDHLTEIYEKGETVTLAFQGGFLRWEEPPIQDAHILSWINITDSQIVENLLIAYPIVWSEVEDEEIPV